MNAKELIEFLQAYCKPTDLVFIETKCGHSEITESMIGSGFISNNPFHEDIAVFNSPYKEYKNEITVIGGGL